MKTLYTLISLFVAHFGFAQCNLSLNNTFIICDYNNLPLSLESGLQVSGGTEPYSYYWNCFWEILPGSPINMDENDILDDPTSSHPTIINSVPGDTLQLFLTVTDAEMNTCEASILVITSCFITTLGGGCEAVSIDTGESATLCTETSACIEPATYSWTPAESLNDASLPNPVATPQESTTYTCTITDALGCTASSEMIVNIQTIDIRNEVEYYFMLYPNPANDRLNIQLSNPSDVFIYTTTGQLLETYTAKSNYQIDISHYPAGLYLVVSGGVMKRFVRE